MPGFPVHHQLLELAQTHVHLVGGAIQPSHPVSSCLLLFSILPSIRVFSKGKLGCCHTVRVQRTTHRTQGLSGAPLNTSASNCLILCYPLLLLLSVFLSIRVFFDESAFRIRWPKYWSFSFSIWIFRWILEYWFDLLAFKGLLRLFSSTTVWKHQFFDTQPSLWSNFHICTWLDLDSVLKSRDITLPT